MFKIQVIGISIARRNGFKLARVHVNGGIILKKRRKVPWFWSFLMDWIFTVSAWTSLSTRKEMVFLVGHLLSFYLIVCERSSHLFLLWKSLIWQYFLTQQTHELKTPFFSRHFLARDASSRYFSFVNEDSYS